jgi:hypothetical protein
MTWQQPLWFFAGVADLIDIFCFPVFTEITFLEVKVFEGVFLTKLVFGIFALDVKK